MGIPKFIYSFTYIWMVICSFWLLQIKLLIKLYWRNHSFFKSWAYTSYMTKAVYRRKECEYLHEHLYVNVHDSFIHSSSKLETAQMSNNSWIDKHNMVCPYNGLLLNNRKAPTADIQQRGWIAESLGEVKGFRHKRLHTVWFRLFEILEKAN